MSTKAFLKAVEYQSTDLCAEALGWMPDGEDATAGILPPQCSTYQQRRGMVSMQPLGQEEDLTRKEEPAGLTLCSL